MTWIILTIFVALCLISGACFAGAAYVSLRLWPGLALACVLCCGCGKETRLDYREHPLDPKDSIYGRVAPVDGEAPPWKIKELKDAIEHHKPIPPGWSIVPAGELKGLPPPDAAHTIKDDR